MTTHVEGQNHFLGSTGSVKDYFTQGNSPSPHPEKQHSVSHHFYLWNEGFRDPCILLNTYNRPDHTLCIIESDGEIPRRIPPIRVAIDGHLQNIPLWETQDKSPAWEIREGQRFDAWLGGKTPDQRDERYGHLTVTWTPPGRKPR